MDAEMARLITKSYIPTADEQKVIDYVNAQIHSAAESGMYYFVEEVQAIKNYFEHYNVTIDVIDFIKLYYRDRKFIVIVSSDMGEEYDTVFRKLKIYWGDVKHV